MLFMRCGQWPFLRSIWEYKGLVNTAGLTVQCQNRKCRKRPEFRLSKEKKKSDKAGPHGFHLFGDNIRLLSPRTETVPQPHFVLLDHPIALRIFRYFEVPAPLASHVLFPLCRVLTSACSNYMLTLTSTLTAYLTQCATLVPWGKGTEYPR